MPDSSGKSNISKPERITLFSTNKDTHFTGALAMNAKEDESITGLLANSIMIRGVNAQSIQNLKYRLIFWGSSEFDNADTNIDSYVSDVVLDFTDTLSAFRIAGAGQYYLDVGGLEIPLNTANLTLYCSLQNLSATSKLAGSTGAVQFDIKYGLRL